MALSSLARRNSAATIDAKNRWRGDVATTPSRRGFRRAASCSGADDARTADVDASTAKYVQGSVGMTRAMNNLLGATKILNGQSDGVMVINLDDGGSLSFYKVRFYLSSAWSHCACCASTSAVMT